jgi:N-acetyl-anhydromuramyl-L-alanine amidase AmpD
MLYPSRRTDPGKPFPWERFKRLVLEAKDEHVPTLVAMARNMLAGAPAGSCCMDHRGFGAKTV